VQLLTTYSGDLNSPDPDGIPVVVGVESGWESLIKDVWVPLDPELKVAVAAFPLEGSSFLAGVAINKKSQ
jgi:hypothetical protein